LLTVTAQQDNHALLTLPNEPLQGVIRAIGSGTRPRHHQAVLVQQETEFTPDDPAVIREAFAADLLRAAAFTDGVDQLHAIGVYAPEDRRGGQEGPNSTSLLPGAISLAEMVLRTFW
jgi:hypothetical protein